MLVEVIDACKKIFDLRLGGSADSWAYMKHKYA